KILSGVLLRIKGFDTQPAWRLTGHNFERRPRLTLFKPQLQASRLTHGTAAFPLANPPRRVLRLGDTLSRFINIYGQNTRQDQVVTTGSRHDPAGWDRCSHIFSVNHDRHKDYGHPGPFELIPLQDV